MLSVAESAKKARLQQGLTVNELSRLSGISAGAISKLERGTSTPNLSTVEMLADTLGLSIDEYVGHEVQNKNEGDNHVTWNEKET